MNLKLYAKVHRNLNDFWGILFCEPPFGLQVSCSLQLPCPFLGIYKMIWCPALACIWTMPLIFGGSWHPQLFFWLLCVLRLFNLGSPSSGSAEQRRSRWVPVRWAPSDGYFVLLMSSECTVKGFTATGNFLIETQYRFVSKGSEGMAALSVKLFEILCI